MGATAFFGLQAVVRAARGSPLRSELRALLVDPSVELGPMEQETRFRRLASSLEDAVPLMERGYWDYVADGAGARREYDSWWGEIEENAGDAGDAALGTGESPYFVVTLAFLLEAGGPSDEETAARCDVAESEYWTRDTFRALIAAVRDLRFASVRADAVYLSAGAIDPETGKEEIDGEGFEYLRPLT